MSWERIGFWAIGCIILIGLVGIGGWYVMDRIAQSSYEQVKTNSTAEKTGIQTHSVSGRYLGSQVWEGEIRVTGDVHIFGSLYIRPGTTIRFEVGDDEIMGEELPADGYNDLDPTRLLGYTTTHSDLLVIGRLMAEGTADAPITFTSARPDPALADWQSIVFLGNGSHLDHVRLEWSRNGIIPYGTHDQTVIENSDFHHNLWAGISAHTASARIENNRISDCGHEGIDFQPGESQAIVRGNVISDCHTGIVVLGGQPTIEDNIIENVGDGIAVMPGARPIVGDNTITLAPDEMERMWRYGQFAYQLRGEPVIIEE